MRVIISGPQSPGPRARDIIRHALLRWEAHNGLDAIGTGCAVGVDTIAAFEARSLFPSAEHHLFIPAAPSNVVALLASGDVWIQHYCAAGPTPSACYGLRNEALCEWARGEGALLAFPASGQERQRSGTWWTIRIAGRMSVPTIIQPLDGSPIRRLNEGTTDYFQTTIEGA